MFLRSVCHLDCVLSSALSSPPLTNADADEEEGKDIEEVVEEVEVGMLGTVMPERAWGTLARPSSRRRQQQPAVVRHIQ